MRTTAYKVALGLLVLLFAPTVAVADTVELRSGGVLVALHRSTSLHAVLPP